ncbi:hypothetical protein YERSI8AC_200201 [Enterobacterales bacterium 8AC]|nr:hypothetical protein YERSI8AC_200201 [Enterobacterales bacterium 8AC]
MKRVLHLSLKKTAIENYLANSTGGPNYYATCFYAKFLTLRCVFISLKGILQSSYNCVL